MKYIITIAIFTLSTFGLAGDQTQQFNNQTKLNFEEFKEACLNPSRFHNQIAPTQIQISCINRELKWVPDLNGAVTMPCARAVTSTLTSDKYVVDSLTASVPFEDQNASCPKFKQVAETLETVRSVSCDEVVSFTGNITDLCAEAADSLKAVNSEAIKVEDTGRQLNFCDAEDKNQNQMQMSPSKVKTKDVDLQPDDKDIAPMYKEEVPLQSRHKKIEGSKKHLLGMTK